MATAIAVGSMLASGGSAVAGAVGAGSILGIGTSTLSTVGMGLGLVGQAFSMFQGNSQADAAYEAQIAASRAELEATRARVAENDVAAQRERTQAALEDAERQRKLRRALAAQRAAFAGGSIDPFSGSPVTIAEDTANTINREQRLSDLATDDRVKSINAQGLGIQASGLGKAASLIGDANAGLSIASQNTMNQLTTFAGNVGDFAGVL